MLDVTERAGVGVLDDTTCALFLDLRNLRRQDLVVATIHGPLLFLNQGDGTFRHKPEAFRFANPAQGTFTGMAAADYDCDGRLDLYLCTYIYFQSEDQYRYPVPYYDSRNGPPNFLFHNQLTADGGGFFQDVTARTGMDMGFFISFAGPITFPKAVELREGHPGGRPGSCCTSRAHTARRVGSAPPGCARTGVGATGSPRGSPRTRPQSRRSRAALLDGSFQSTATRDKEGGGHGREAPPQPPQDRSPLGGTAATR